MPWTNIPDFTVGQTLTSSRMNQMRNNDNIGHRVCTSTTRPASPDEGTMIYETDTQKTYLRDASSWREISAGAVNYSITSPAASITVDSLGRVTHPNQPMFSYARTGGSTTAGSDWSGFNQGNTNIGSNFNTSNGRFTAPIAGRYYFAAGAFKEASVGPPSSFEFLVNNTTTFGGAWRAYTDQASYAALPTLVAIFTLAANDYVTVRQTGGAVHGNSSFHYTGFLVG